MFHTESEEPRREVGTVDHVNTARGFVFIQPAPGGPRLFAHITAFDPVWQPIDVRDQLLGRAVSYERGAGAQGRPAAKRIFVYQSNEEIAAQIDEAAYA